MAWELNLKANTYDNQLVTNKIISSVTVGVQDGAKADATPEEERKKKTHLPNTGKTSHKMHRNEGDFPGLDQR